MPVTKEQCSRAYWISIEYRLPTKMDRVLVTDGTGKVMLAEYRGNDWWVSIPGAWNLYVVAWMPLPEPYIPAKRFLAPKIS